MEIVKLWFDKWDLEYLQEAHTRIGPEKDFHEWLENFIKRKVIEEM